MQKQKNNHQNLDWESRIMFEKERKIIELTKTLSETVTERELVKRGFYLSLPALRKEWKQGINCPAHEVNEKGEYFCSREGLIEWLQNVLAETGMLHYSCPEQNAKVIEARWEQLELDF